MRQPSTPPAACRPRLPRRIGLAAACLTAALAVQAAAQEPAPAATGPAIDTPPPMYIPEPFAAGSLAGMPDSVVAERLPQWPRWFAGASGLVMTRTLPTSAATMQPLGGTQLTTGAAGATWPGGVDLHIGRWFGPHQRHAVECIYWGVYNLGSTAAATSNPPGIDAIPQAPGVTIGGLPAAAFLVDAAGPQIGRSDVINDVEINWVYAPGQRPEFLPRERAVNLMWLAGFRFFEVGDTLTLTSQPGDAALAAPDLAVATNNNLYGAQVGAKFDWRFLPTVRFNVVPKFMIGGNSITNTTSLQTATGDSAVFVDGQPVRVHAEMGVFSWLGSVDTGLAWDVTERWTLSLGYRVVGVGNIAQADGQWPTVLADPAAVSGIDAGSSTIVHGGFAGFEGRW